MKYTLRILILSVCFFSKTYAQNLVPNHSFELYTSCPTDQGIGDVVNWINPNIASPDYFNSCSVAPPLPSNGVPLNSRGFQHAHTGNAYVGVFAFNTPNSTDVREYIQTELLDTLDIGKNYCISFYVSCADQYLFNTAITEMGLYLSNTAITSSNYLVFNVTPQITSPPGFYLNDTLNWYKIEGTYTALGGERYITIGNFKTDALTDTICWNLNDTNCAPFCYPNSYYYIDDVSVIDCNDTSTSVLQETKNDYSFNLYPNPSTGSFSIKYDSKQSNDAVFKLYDIRGKLLNETVLKNENTSFDFSDVLANGVYFYQVSINNKMVKSDKVVIIK